MTKLSQFMSDMRDSERTVEVPEKDLRRYAQQANQWEIIAKSQSEEIKKLQNQITCLQSAKEVLEHKLSQRGEIIDLFN